ncbi:LytTR family DNA-binding domain-containing protein [uncultured Polaribacter sp.]|uniref:LytR/AlgR family response regulator transcription factor n=1 Tax=uncultured Polaribacter sp. TaxID=174711 RepID=UPI002613CC77|nr:LytTR family DNA-binding domain-containing protein [uncultured Polaribacter sp.]
MEKVIKCIIVDDEPPAIRLLEKYIQKVLFLELVATTTNALEALQIIETNPIELVFLDIQMPNLTGIQLSKIVDDNIKIIFTTAYPQFALESYDLNAVDYLLKPFDFERFYKAVSKVKILNTAPKDKPNDETLLFIKTNGKNNFEKIYISEILYLEGLKNYVAIHLVSKQQIITYSTLKYMNDRLPKQMFTQIHKSYIVAMQHIEKTSSTGVQINEKELPLGNSYKNIFFESIEKNKL